MGEMKKVEKSRIKEGICFNKPVFFEDGENMFLAPNHPVKRYHMQALARWSVPFLLSEGQEIDPKELLKKTQPQAPSASEPSSTYKAKSINTQYEDVDLNSIGNPDDGLEELEEVEELEEAEDFGELEEL